MSRALALADRVPGDAYLTPDPLARSVCGWLARRITPGVVVEPSAGSGAFVRAARATWPEAHVTANEIDRARRRELLQAGAHLVLHQDWRLLALQLANTDRAADAPARLVLGNPPFREAEKHIEAGLAGLRPGDALAFLLRLNLLGSAARVPFWRAHPPAWVAPIVPRPSFTGGGTDGTEYAVFVWQGGGDRRARGARLAPSLVWRSP